jgi:hypothetical protein
MESTKDDGRGYDELAPRSDVFAGNLSLGVPDLLKDALASRQVVVPRVGKSNPSRSCNYPRLARPARSPERMLAGEVKILVA